MSSLDPTEWQWLTILSETLQRQPTASFSYERVINILEQLASLLEKENTAYDCARHYPQVAPVLAALTSCRAILLHPRIGTLFTRCLMLYSRYGMSDDTSRMANDWGREQLRHCSRILDTSNNDDNDHHHNDTMAIVQACASGTRPFVLATAEHMAHSIGVMMTTMEQQIEITLDNQERLWTYIETYCLPLLSIPEAYPIIEQLLYSVCKRQPRSSSGMSTNETNVTLSNRLVMWLSIEHLDIFCKLSFHCQNTVYYYYPNLLKEQMAKCASALVVSPSSSSSSLMTLTQLRVLLSHWPLWCLCRKYPNLLEQSMLVWCQLVIEFPDWQLVRIARCWIRLSLLALKDQSSSSSWMNSKQQQPFGELLMTCQSLAIQLQRIEHIRKHGAGYVEQELHDELFEKIRQALITIPAMVYDHYHPPPPPTLANTLVWLLLGAWPTWHITSTTSVNDGYTRTVAWMLVPTGIPMTAPSSNLQATTRQLIRDVAQFVQQTAKLDGLTGFASILDEATRRAHQVLANPILTEWTLGQCYSQMSTYTGNRVVTPHSDRRSTSSVQQRLQHPFIDLLQEKAKKHKASRLLLSIVLADVQTSFAE